MSVVLSDRTLKPNTFGYKSTNYASWYLRLQSLVNIKTFFIGQAQTGYKVVMRNGAKKYYSHKTGTAQKNKIHWWLDFGAFDIRVAVLHSSPANYFYKS